LNSDATHCHRPVAVHVTVPARYRRSFGYLPRFCAFTRTLRCVYVTDLVAVTLLRSIHVAFTPLPELLIWVVYVARLRSHVDSRCYRWFAIVTLRLGYLVTLPRWVLFGSSYVAAFWLRLRITYVYTFCRWYVITLRLLHTFRCRCYVRCYSRYVCVRVLYAFTHVAYNVAWVYVWRRFKFALHRTLVYVTLHARLVLLPTSICVVRCTFTVAVPFGYHVPCPVGLRTLRLPHVYLLWIAFYAHYAHMVAPDVLHTHGLTHVCLHTDFALPHTHVTLIYV